MRLTPAPMASVAMPGAFGNGWGCTAVTEAGAGRAGQWTVSFRLRRGATIRGKVSDLSGRGKAALVTLVGTSALGAAGESKNAEAGPDGRFSLMGLSAGSYLLGATGTDFNIIHQKVEVAEGAEVQVELRERQGATVMVNVEPKLTCVGTLSAAVGDAERQLGMGTASGVITFSGVSAGSYRLSILCPENRRSTEQVIEVTQQPQQRFTQKVD